MGRKTLKSLDLLQKRKNLVLATLLCAGIFVLDHFSGLQTAIGVLYVLPLALLMNMHHSIFLRFALVSCALLLADPRLIIGAPGYDSLYTDKVLAVMAIAITAAGMLRYKKLHVKSMRSKDEQVKRLEQLLYDTSQNVLKPANNIHGLSLIMKMQTSSEEKDWILNSLRKSAAELDQCTKELRKYARDPVN